MCAAISQVADVLAHLRLMQQATILAQCSVAYALVQEHSQLGCCWLRQTTGRRCAPYRQTTEPLCLDDLCMRDV